MKVSRFAKCVLFLVLTAVSFGVSVYLQLQMHKPGLLEKSYYTMNTYIFITAIALIGSGIYSIQSYTRSHREHLTDSVIFIIFGLVLLIEFVMIWIFFGGLDKTFDESAYVAVNVNIAVLSILPILFWIRAVVLAFSLQEPSRSKRVGVRLCCVILLAAMIAAMCFGGMFHMMRFTGDPSEDVSTESMIDTETY